MNSVLQLFQDSGAYQLEGGQFVMILIGMLLIYLAIRKGFEPLLLLPIGMGAILVNIPGAGFLAAPVYDATGHMDSPGGLLYYIYEAGIATGIFPLIIFMGVGAMTDFGPLLANPRTLFLGAAAQFGIFTTVLGALGLTSLRLMDFSLADAAAIGIIGGADGPTAIFVSRRHCCSSLFLYGVSTNDSAAYYESSDNTERARDSHGAATASFAARKNYFPIKFAGIGGVVPAHSSTAVRYVLLRQPDERKWCCGKA